MSGEELTAALRRSRRRQQGMLDKQLSCDSQDPESALERVRYDDQSQSACVDQSHCRFDDNVSFIEAAVCVSPEEAESAVYPCHLVTDSADARLSFKVGVTDCCHS